MVYRKDIKKMPFLTIRMMLILFLFFNQQVCGMERLVQWGYSKLMQYYNPIQFEQFSVLSPEIQLLVFKHSDNKANFQRINKYFFQARSISNNMNVIKLSDLFDDIDDTHISRMFLHAVYHENYAGVENILKNSYLNKIEKKNLCYRYIDTNQAGNEVVLDPYQLGNANSQMIELLKKYNVENIASDKKAAIATLLIMACISGDSDNVTYPIIVDKTDVKRALNIAVDCDHAKCIKQLIYNWSDAFGDLFCGDKNESLLNRQLFKRACINKSCKVLKVLLDDGRYNINEELSGATLLDEVVELAKTDCTFDVVIALLQQYYAQTSQQIAAYNASINQDDEHSWCFFS